MLVKDLRDGDRVKFDGTWYTVDDNILRSDDPYNKGSIWIYSMDRDKDIRQFLKTDRDRNNELSMHQGSMVVNRMQSCNIYNSY